MFKFARGIALALSIFSLQILSQGAQALSVAPSAIKPQLELENSENHVHKLVQIEDESSLRDTPELLYMYAEQEEFWNNLIHEAKYKRKRQSKRQSKRQHSRRRQSHRGYGALGGTRDHSSPVWGPFMARLQKCAPDCRPYNYRAFDNRGGRSCHNSGRAIDVHGFMCGGKVSWAVNGGRFAEISNCIRRSGMKVLYRNNADHYDHGHFSITCHNGTYW